MRAIIASTGSEVTMERIRQGNRVACRGNAIWIPFTMFPLSDGHAGMAENRFAALQDPVSVENEARGET